MTYDEGIESLIDTCKNLQDAIDDLQKENAFLSDTIEKYNLGQIKLERRSLLEENEQCKKTVATALHQAEELKLEYAVKIADADKKLTDAKMKEKDINTYINNAAKKKLSEMKDDYERQKEKNDKLLEQMQAELEKQKSYFAAKNKKWAAFGICGIIIGLIGLLANFL